MSVEAFRQIAAHERALELTLRAVAIDLERAGIPATTTRAAEARSRLSAEQLERGETPH